MGFGTEKKLRDAKVSSDRKSFKFTDGVQRIFHGNIEETLGQSPIIYSFVCHIYICLLWTQCQMNMWVNFLKFLFFWPKTDNLK